EQIRYDRVITLEKADGAHFLRVAGSAGARSAGRRVVLLLGLLKAEQEDAALRGAAELGVDELRPLLCGRSVPKIAPPELPKKMSRWRRILDEGSKISGYAIATKISEPRSLAELDWASLPSERYAALLRQGARPIRDASPGPDVALAIGPEGDWTEPEVFCLLENGFEPIDLGPGVLRSSTAAIVGCGWLRLS
ncbi:MAG: RNA methyltransferase, partial [Synergistaceae bacterium]|nr:RNA methyltransferase [Synergistaceae bacterium]